MQRTRLRVLAALAVGACVVGRLLLLTLRDRGILLDAVGWPVVVALTGMAVLVLAAGWTVRQAVRGRRRLDPLQAARRAVLAKACALAGALLTGWYVAQGLAVLGELRIEPQRDRAVAAAVAVAASVVLTVAAVIAERLCRVPPAGPAEDDASPGPPSGGAPA